MAGQERVIVVGGGGFGREIICWVHDCVAAGKLPALGGYIDDEVEALPGYDVERVGTIQDYQPQSGDRFIVAMGEPSKKRKVVEMLQERGAQFATLIHPTCTIVRTATIGEGVILCPYAMMMPDSRADRFVSILNYSGLGHDAVAGEFTSLSSVVDVTGRCVIGKDVSIGSGARLLPGIKVGDGATIGAGAIVVRSVKPGMTVYAAPAKTLNMNKQA
jgi:sugar O-acyltransferase (sialic acid O-acetyltransferase NeuD family)